jgi:hypothetical protein
MKKYLPSKKFTIIASIIIGVVGISLAGVNYYFSKKNSRGLMANVISVVTGQDLSANISLNNLVQKDSDGDGIFDWEESLWGTDPYNKSTNEGVEDKDFVEKKKKELAANNEDESGISNEENLNETEKFSREFFATVTALKQSGNLNEGSVSNIANVVGEKMSNSNLSNKYRITDLKKTYDVTAQNQEDFYNTVGDIYEKYRNQGLGTELDNMDTSTGESDALELARISQVYQDFSKEVADLPVPSNLTQNALDIINGAYNTGLAIKNLSQMTDNPLVGLIGLTQYQKWSEQFINSSEDLETYLVDNSIIN